MQSSNHVVIVGGGIVGTSCAWHARRKGFNVTVIDPLEARARASYGNAGVLAACEYLPIGTPTLIKELPRMLLAKDSPLQLRWRYLPALSPWLLRFVRASTPGRVEHATKALRALLSGAVAAHQEIAGAANAGDMLHATGWIKACESTRAYDALDGERRLLSELGVGMTRLSANELDDLLPGLPGIFARGTLFTDCMQVKDPGEYLDRIVLACQDMGVRFVKGMANGLRIEHGRIAAVQTESGPVVGDMFVIAAGAWSKRLAEQAGERVYLDTERGYHAMLGVSHPDLLRAPLLWHEKSVVLSQQPRGVRITSSVEFAGLHAPARYEGLDRIVQSIGRAAPALNAPVVSKWLGFRPSTPDSLPVIGRSRKQPNCFMAFGHGHLGLTLGPITGRLIAQAISDPNGSNGSVDLQPFSPARFGRL